MTTKAMTHALVQPDWLEEHLDDTSLRLIEVDVSTAAYDTGHIPGAVLWSIYRDLKDANYQLRDTAELETLVRASGIEPGSTVVVYGYGAAMGFWLLTTYGHADVRLLDLGRDTWHAQDRPWTTEVPVPTKSDYVLGEQDLGVRALLEDVVHASATTTLLDVRSSAEFAGERFWPSGAPEPTGRPGHIPKAVHLPPDGIVDENGCYASISELERLFQGLDDQADVITYCAVGGRASQAWFVLTQLLGRVHVRVYDGSWAEWGRRPDLPVITTQPKENAMSGLVRMTLDAPEEVRPFEGGTGQVELVNLEAGHPVRRATFLPGWRWSEHVKPIAKTESCQAAHLCYFVSGRMTVVMTDGEQMTYGTGDFAIMAPGHDAWIVGDEACVVVDWQGYANYAKR